MPITFLDQSELAVGEFSRELEGETLGIPASVVFVDAAPSEGTSLHVHPYAELFFGQACGLRWGHSRRRAVPGWWDRPCCRTGRTHRSGGVKGEPVFTLPVLSLTYTCPTIFETREVDSDAEDAALTST